MHIHNRLGCLIYMLYAYSETKWIQPTAVHFEYFRTVIIIQQHPQMRSCSYSLNKQYFGVTQLNHVQCNVAMLCPHIPSQLAPSETCGGLAPSASVPHPHFTSSTAALANPNNLSARSFCSWGTLSGWYASEYLLHACK